MNDTFPDSVTSEQQVALVTGGSRGLGRALVVELARRGWIVVTDARDAEALARIAGTSADIVAVPGDVTDPTHRRDLIDTSRDAGALRLVIANAGTLGPSPLPALAEVDLTELGTTFAINTTAQLGLAQAALTTLRDTGGTLAFVTSDAAVEAYPGWGVYGASKAAVEAIGRVLAEEEPLVRVLVVDPGDVRTDMHQAAFPGEDISDRPLPDEVAPRLVDLLTGPAPSGRHRVSDVPDPARQVVET